MLVLVGGKVEVECFCADDPLERNDLVIDAAHRHPLSVGSLPDPAERAAHFHGVIAGRQRPSGGPEQPAPEQIGVGHRFPDQSA